MYIRTTHDSITNRDRTWPVEPKEYKDLLELMKKEGKLLDRIINKIDDYTVELTWIFDSKASWESLFNNPIQVARRAEIADFSTFTVISEEEI